MGSFLEYTQYIKTKGGGPYLIIKYVLLYLDSIF